MHIQIYICICIRIQQTSCRQSAHLGAPLLKHVDPELVRGLARLRRNGDVPVRVK